MRFAHFLRVGILLASTRRETCPPELSPEAARELPAVSASQMAGINTYPAFDRGDARFPDREVRETPTPKDII